MADLTNIYTKTHGHHVVRRQAPSTGLSGPLARTSTVSSRVKALQAVWKSGGDITDPHSPLLTLPATHLPPLVHYQSFPVLQVPPRDSTLKPQNLHRASSSIEEYCVRSVERIKINPETPRIRRERSKKLLSSSPLLQRRRTRRSRAEASDSIDKEQELSTLDTEAIESTHTAITKADNQAQDHQALESPPPFPFSAGDDFTEEQIQNINPSRGNLDSSRHQETFSHLARIQTGIAYTGLDAVDDSHPKPAVTSLPDTLVPKDMQQGNPAEFFASAFAPKTQRPKHGTQMVQDEETSTMNPLGPPKNTVSVRDRIRSFQVTAPSESPKQDKNTGLTIGPSTGGDNDIRHLAKRFEEGIPDKKEYHAHVTPDKPVDQSSDGTLADLMTSTVLSSPKKQEPAPGQTPESKAERDVKAPRHHTNTQTGFIGQHGPSHEAPRTPDAPISAEQPFDNIAEATSTERAIHSPRLKHQVTNKIAHLTEQLIQRSPQSPEPKKLRVPKPIDIPQHLNVAKRASPSPAPLVTSAVSPDLVLQHPSPQHHTPPMRNLPPGQPRISSSKSLADQLGNMIDDALETEWTPNPRSSNKNPTRPVRQGDETDLEPVLEDWLEDNVKERSRLFQSDESRHRRERSQVVESPNEITPTSKSSRSVTDSRKDRNLAADTDKRHEIKEAVKVPDPPPATLPSRRNVSTGKTVRRQASSDYDDSSSNHIETIVETHEEAVEPRTSSLTQRSIRTRIQHLHDCAHSQTRVSSHNSTHTQPEPSHSSGNKHRRRNVSDEYHNNEEHAAKVLRGPKKPSMDGNDADVDEEGSSSSSERSRKKYEIYVRENLREGQHKETDRKDLKRPHKKSDATDRKVPQENNSKTDKRVCKSAEVTKHDSAPTQPKHPSELRPKQIRTSFSNTAPWRWWKLVLVDKPSIPSSMSSDSRPSILNPPVPPARTSSMKASDTQKSAAYRRMRSLHELKTKEKGVEYSCSGCGLTSTDIGNEHILRKAGTESNDSLAQHLLGVLTRRYPRKQREIPKACDVHHELHKPHGYVCQAQTSDTVHSDAARHVIRPPSIHSIATFPVGEDAHLLSPSTPAMTSKEMSDTCDGVEAGWKGSDGVSRHDREVRAPEATKQDVADKQAAHVEAKEETTSKTKSKVREGVANITKTDEGEQSAWDVGKAQKAEESVKRVEVVVCFENGGADAKRKGKEETEGWEVEVSVRNRGRLRKRRLTID